MSVAVAADTDRGRQWSALVASLSQGRSELHLSFITDIHMQHLTWAVDTDSQRDGGYEETVWARLLRG